MYHFRMTMSTDGLFKKIVPNKIKKFVIVIIYYKRFIYTNSDIGKLTNNLLPIRSNPMFTKIQCIEKKNYLQYTILILTSIHMLSYDFSCQTYACKLNCIVLALLLLCHHKHLFVN